MKTKEDIIVRSKRDLYEHFDARIKRIEDKIEEMCAIEDIAKSESGETVILQLAYYTKTIPQADLFEVGEDELHVQLHVKKADVGSSWCVAKRTLGPLAGKAFYLNERYDWELGRDTESRLCLVPIKKKS